MGVTTITANAIISAPKESVWQLLRDIGALEKYHPLVKKSTVLSQRSSGLGAIRNCKLLPMGMMKEEVMHWIENESYTMAVTDGKMLPPYHFMKGTVTLSDNEGDTQVTFSFSYQLKYGILGELANSLFIRSQFSKAPPQYVNGLKKYVEEQNFRH